MASVTVDVRDVDKTPRFDEKIHERAGRPLMLPHNVSNYLFKGGLDILNFSRGLRVCRFLDSAAIRRGLLGETTGLFEACFRIGYPSVSGG